VLPPTAAWCDYVFENDYQLMPLKDLGKYVTANKHLPKIPTTAEIAKTGVNIGEINVLYLKKIEELILYLIDLHKQVDELKKKY
jgi:type I site-specific restriction endonuclease